MDFSERLFRYSNANDVTFSVKIYLIANWRICRSQPDAVVLASLLCCGAIGKGNFNT